MREVVRLAVERKAVSNRLLCLIRIFCKNIL